MAKQDPRGKKGIIQKIGEGLSRKWRGKEKTEHKGLEQDKKTGYYTHKAPKDRLDTEPGRIHLASARATGPAKFAKIFPRPKSNDMSYKERKKEIERDKKEAKRKADFDKKHKVGKYRGGPVRTKVKPRTGRGLRGIGGLGSGLSPKGLSIAGAKKSAEKIKKDLAEWKEWREDRKKKKKPAIPLGGGIHKPQPGSWEYVQQDYLLKPGYKKYSTGGDSIKKGRDLAKKHKKKLGEKIGVGLGYASEVARSVPTPLNTVRKAVESFTQRHKKKSGPAGAAQAPRPTTSDYDHREPPKGPDMRDKDRLTDRDRTNIWDKRKEGMGKAKHKPKKLSHGGEARVRGMGAAIRGGKFEGIF